jgi:hypothetical protein
VVEDVAFAQEQQWVLNSVSAGGSCGASSGPSTVGVSLSVGARQYVNPFAAASVSPSRIDQGVDYDGRGPILAIGNATIEYIASAPSIQWPGYYYIGYQLDDGPLAGRWVYVAEDIAPANGLYVGEHVRAGQQIASFVAGGSIETGWALPDPGYPGPVAVDIYRTYGDGTRTAPGQAFSDFLVSLGAPAGCGEGKPVIGSFSY